MWVRNCWYVIAWDHEISDDALFTRTVLDEPILVYRTEGGELAAMQDRCCHRHAPLSRGRRKAIASAAATTASSSPPTAFAWRHRGWPAFP